MIQLLKGRDINKSALMINGVGYKYDEVIFAGGSKARSDIAIIIRNEQACKAAISHHFSELPTECSYITFANLEYLFLPDSDISRQSTSVYRDDNGSWRVSFALQMNLHNWKHLWSVNEYIKEVSKVVTNEIKEGAVFSERVKPDFRGPYDLFLPSFSLSFIVKDIENTIETEILSLEAIVRAIHELTEKSLASTLNNHKVERIIRSIEFPPEYHRSGITILSYFADVLRHKNLSEEVKVSIEQNGLNVSLVIETPAGQREQIERTLETYGLVVTRREPIETLTTNPYEVAELKSQLRLAEVQIETQRELLAAKNADMQSLRTEVKDTQALVKQIQEQAGEDRARFTEILRGGL